MKKLFLVLIALIFINLSVFAEEITPRGVVMTKETHPIFWSYMEDYGAQLQQAFKKKRMFKIRSWGASYRYYITRDGEIKDMTRSIWHNEYYAKKIKEVILSVKPLPFKEGMNADKMCFDVFFSKEKYEEIEISVGYSLGISDKVFSIIISVK